MNFSVSMCCDALFVGFVLHLSQKWLSSQMELLVQTYAASPDAGGSVSSK